MPAASSGRTLGRAYFARTAPEVAPDLLNTVLVVGGCAVRIVETEAYTQDDPASHSFRGPTVRNASMFGPPGHLYVYFTYGMHWCTNVVCGPTGSGEAVLLRAGEPLWGIEEMRRRRTSKHPQLRDRELANGPAKLSSALGLARDFDGRDLCDRQNRLRIIVDPTNVWPAPLCTSRIGISVALDRQWRWAVPDSPWVSRRPGSI